MAPGIFGFAHSVCRAVPSICSICICIYIRAAPEACSLRPEAWRVRYRQTPSSDRPWCVRPRVRGCVEGSIHDHQRSELWTGDCLSVRAVVPVGVGRPFEALTLVFDVDPGPHGRRA